MTGRRVGRHSGCRRTCLCRRRDWDGAQHVRRGLARVVAAAASAVRRAARAPAAEEALRRRGHRGGGPAAGGRGVPGAPVAPGPAGAARARAPGHPPPRDGPRVPRRAHRPRQRGRPGDRPAPGGVHPGHRPRRPPGRPGLLRCRADVRRTPRPVRGQGRHRAPGERAREGTGRGAGRGDDGRVAGARLGRARDAPHPLRFAAERGRRLHQVAVLGGGHLEVSLVALPPGGAVAHLRLRGSRDGPVGAGDVAPGVPGGG